MTTQPISSIPADVAEFVAQVRGALADLPPDDVDELTVGLAADLTDARAESPHAWREGVGSPVAYAAELRSAAGLPPAGPVAAPSPLDGLQQWWDALSDHPVLGRVKREAHELAPAWWVIRGAIGGLVIAQVIGRMGLINPVTIVLMLLGAAVSVWLGRRLRTGAGGGLRVLSIGASALALFCGLVLSTFVNPGAGSYPEPYVPYELMNEGEQVTELYGFDAEGERIEGLRVFDQAGRPLKVYTVEGFQTDTFPVSAWSLLTTPEDPVRWTPPMTLPSVEVSGRASESTETSTSVTEDDPSGTSSSSSSSSSSQSSATTKGEARTPSPRSTASPSTSD